MKKKITRVTINLPTQLTGECESGKPGLFKTIDSALNEAERVATILLESKKLVAHLNDLNNKGAEYNTQEVISGMMGLGSHDVVIRMPNKTTTVYRALLLVITETTLN